jgi:hypothetical protein
VRLAGIPSNQATAMVCAIRGGVASHVAASWQLTGCSGSGTEIDRKRQEKEAAASRTTADPTRTATPGF